MVAVELLVVLGLFVVVVVGGAEGGAGTLVGPVGQDQDLPGEAGLDDAVRAGRGQVVRAARCRAGEPQWGAVRACDDLDIHAVLLVLLRVVRLVRGDTVGGDERAVDDDEVSFAEPDEGLVQTRRPGGQDFECLVDVAPGRCLRYPEPGTDLCERLVLP